MVVATAKRGIVDDAACMCVTITIPEIVEIFSTPIKMNEKGNTSSTK